MGKKGRSKSGKEKQKNVKRVTQEEKSSEEFFDASDTIATAEACLESDSEASCHATAAVTSNTDDSESKDDNEKKPDDSITVTHDIVQEEIELKEALNNSNITRVDVNSETEVRDVSQQNGSEAEIKTAKTREFENALICDGDQRDDDDLVDNVKYQKSAEEKEIDSANPPDQKNQRLVEKSAEVIDILTDSEANVSSSQKASISAVEQLKTLAAQENQIRVSDESTISNMAKSDIGTETTRTEHALRKRLKAEGTEDESGKQLKAEAVGKPSNFDDIDFERVVFGEAEEVKTAVKMTNLPEISEGCNIKINDNDLINEQLTLKANFEDSAGTEYDKNNEGDCTKAFGKENDREENIGTELKTTSNLDNTQTEEVDDKSTLITEDLRHENSGSLSEISSENLSKETGTCGGEPQSIPEQRTDSPKIENDTGKDVAGKFGEERKEKSELSDQSKREVSSSEMKSESISAPEIAKNVIPKESVELPGSSNEKDGVSRTKSSRINDDTISIHSQTQSIGDASSLCSTLISPKLDSDATSEVSREFSPDSALDSSRDGGSPDSKLFGALSKLKSKRWRKSKKDGDTSPSLGIHFNLGQKVCLFLVIYFLQFIHTHLENN